MTDHNPYEHQPVPPSSQAPESGWSNPESYSQPASPPSPPQYPPHYAEYSQYYSMHYPEYPQQYAPPPAPPAPAKSHGVLIGLGSALAAAALVLGGVALTNNGSSTAVAGTGSVTQQDPDSGSGSGGTGNGTLPGGTLPGGSLPGGSLPGGSGGGSGSGSGSASGGTTANATQQVGIVTIVSTLKYENAQSAGTGMILSSDGEVLTNNHVIRGATSVVVTVESTGKQYKAKVVGTAPASDVAVIQLEDASGLQTAKLADDASDVQVGDAVTGVGNAGGTGTLTQASGKVTGLDKSITASDESGQDAERLTDLIEVNARIISGDSGGPLYDSDGEIVGMNTAASTTQSSTSTAYAIPVENALEIADKIESGVETAAIHLGYPGFLGISSKDSTTGKGAEVAGLLDGGPAADAGITDGSVITGIDGTAVTSADSLRAILTLKDPGSSVKVTWTDPNGQSRSATVTLTTGPAD